MAAEPTRLQIVVAPDPLSCKALQYVLDNLDTLRRLNVRFTVIRVPTEKEKLAPLVSRGITNTPTLVMPDGKLMIGLDAIKKIIDKNVSRVDRMRAESRTGGNSMNSAFTRTGDELNDWMLANMLDNAPRGRNGRVTQMSNDDNESMGENSTNDDDEQGLPSDFSSRMANFESRRKSAMPPDPYGNTPRDDAPRRRRPNNNARPADNDDGGYGGEIRRNVGNIIDDGDDFNNSPAMGRRSGGGVPKLPERKQRGANVSEAEMERMMMEAMVDSRDGPGVNGRGY